MLQAKVKRAKLSSSACEPHGMGGAHSRLYSHIQNYYMTNYKIYYLYLLQPTIPHLNHITNEKPLIFN